jgi:hypothetical protein
LVVRRREFTVLINAPLKAAFTVVVEFLGHAWRHDFPDPSQCPPRAAGVEVVPQSLPSHPLWDRDIDCSGAEMSPEWTTRIRGWIEEARAHDPKALSPGGDAVMLYADIGGAAYLRSDGAILGAGWDEEPVVETDPRWLVLAIIHGSKRRPDLSQLLPIRPSRAEDCRACSGAGAGEVGNHRLVCWNCAGLGWWPPAQPTLIWPV